MSSAKDAIVLIDNSAKDPDLITYKMNLLARTLKSNKIMPEFLDELMDFYAWLKGQPKDMQDNVWLPQFKSFVVAVEATSSESGWLMDLITQHRANIRYTGNSPEARKFALGKANQEATTQMS